MAYCPGNQNAQQKMAPKEQACSGCIWHYERIGPPPAPPAPPPQPTPAPTPPPPYTGTIYWIKGVQGENCDTTCGSQDDCIEDGYPTSLEAFKKILADMGDESCASFETGDWLVNPADYVDYGDACYWKAESQDAQTRCGASHYAVARYCPCKTSKETTAAPTTTAPTTRPSRRRCGTRRRCPGRRRRRRKASIKNAKGERRRRRHPGRRRKTAQA